MSAWSDRQADAAERLVGAVRRNAANTLPGTLLHRMGYRTINARHLERLTRVLGDDIEGDSTTIAREHARLALEARDAGQRLALLSGGETTVTIRGSGRGGPNAEYVLALALALDGAAGIAALAADSDGIDGSADNAGAVCFADTITRARAAGLDAEGHLANNDSHGFFAALGDLVMSGPTRTNVNDFRAILVAPEV